MNEDIQATKLETPLLTIGVPVFNEEKNILATLESLSSQDYPNFEIIISDNHSADATLELCQQFAKNNARVHVYSNDFNKGAGWNFENVLSMAKGDFFMWAGAHDRWDLRFASRCIRSLTTSTDNVSAFPAANFVDGNASHITAITTAYDTQGVGSRVRPWITAWLLASHYAYPIYGVHRTAAIRKVCISNKCVGPDIVALFELAFLGSTAYVPGPALIELRQNSDYGDWAKYLNRIYLSDGFSEEKLFQDMRSAFLSAIKRRVKSARGRVFHSLCLMVFLPVLQNLAKLAAKGSSDSKLGFRQ